MIRPHLIVRRVLVFVFMWASIHWLAAAGVAQIQTIRPSRIIVSPRATLSPAQMVDLQKQTMIQAGQPVAAGVAAVQANAVGASPENVRLQKLMQLKFDRRTAGYLKKWSDHNLPAVNSENEDSGEQVDATSSTIEADKPSDELPPQPPRLAERDAARLKRIEAEVSQFQSDVVLGNWSAVKDYLGALPEKDAKQLYDHLLTSLMSVPMTAPQNGDPEEMQMFQAQQQAQRMGLQEKQFLSPTDVLSLANSAPEDPTEEQLAKLSSMVQTARTNGFTMEGFVDQLKAGTTYFGGDTPEKRLRAGTLLIKSGQSEQASEFLPDLETALSEKDVDQLLLVISFQEQLYAREKKAEQLEETWGLVQSVLELDELESAKRKVLLGKAVELSTRVREELGTQWLKESFTEYPERGLQILSSMGISSAQNILTNFQQPTIRLKTLKLQNAAVESLLTNAPELANEWKPTLNVLLQNWMKEVDTSLKFFRGTSSRPRMQLDMYGNYFWSGQNNPQGNQRQIQPINVSDLIKIKPSIEWQKLINESLVTEFNSRIAQLHLKNEEAEESFPYVETVCVRDRKRGRILVNEFVTTWIRGHDPNSNNNQRNPYIYMYGYDNKAEGIPLTRSKQERNLKELKDWIARIRKLPIEPVDDKLLARAFTTCHSQAEVFKLEAFENVFGSIDTLDAETVSGIVHTMRENLAGKWRSVKLQEQANTKRKAAEIQKDVLEGYDAALHIVNDSLNQNPDSWQLMTAKACIFFDNNAYANSVQKSSKFSKIRDQAFEYFKQAADLYKKQVPTLEEADHSIDTYQRWFYASLGACDVGQITHETVPDTNQFERIRNSLKELPGELSDQHVGKFANDLFTRMSPLKPQVKFRYLEGGFSIVGDHERAEEARKVYEYYRDLVTEIKLKIQIDGSDTVGHEQSFGLFVNLVHTPEIERESGGFAKYVQNQNQMPYAFNYGRPTEDYRTKFHEATSKALDEHFDVQSIIFEDPKTMKSREFGPGWRVTPYAYVLLKARGPEVDKIPSLKIDFDFLDTSGYAVLPIESQMLPLGRGNPSGEPRPVSDLEIVQTLDERRASEGKLILEIKAEATGLVPQLEQIVDLEIDGFEVVNIEDQPVVPTTFNDASNEISIKSDRSWTVEMKASGKTTPEEFHFCSAIIPESSSTFQRYDDADLVEVDRIVSLEKTYAQATNWIWLLLPILIGGLLLMLLAVGAILLLNSKPRTPTRFSMPEEVNPFTVIGLLKDIDSNGRLKDNEKQDLGNSINRIEQYYFDKRNGETAPDLTKLASQWLKKA